MKTKKLKLKKAIKRTKKPSPKVSTFTIAHFLELLREVASQFQWVLEGGRALRGWKNGSRACCPVSAIGGDYTMPVTWLEKSGMTELDARAIVHAADGHGEENLAITLRQTVGLQ